jgi:hypothetical protein
MCPGASPETNQGIFSSCSSFFVMGILQTRSIPGLYIGITKIDGRFENQPCGASRRPSMVPQTRSSLCGVRTAPPKGFVRSQPTVTPPVVIGDDDDFEDASGDEASHAHFEASDNTGRPTFSLFQKPPASILSQYSYKKLSTDVMDTSEALRTARYELRKRAGLIYRHKEIVPANVPRQITEHDACHDFAVHYR